MTEQPAAVWSALLDDEAPLHGSTDASRTSPDATPIPRDLLRSRVVHDTDLPLLRGCADPIHVVVTGGAGQIAGPAGLCARLGLELVGLDVALRDRDDLAGNARRIVAAVDHARSEGRLGDDVTVHVELPADEPTHGWWAAADEVAAAELRLTLRTGGPEGSAPAALLAAWIDAALDRETSVRYAGSGPGTPGPGDLLAATHRAFDGASRDEVVATLESREATADLAPSLHGVRRWVTSIGTRDVAAALVDLRARGVVP